MFESRRSQAVQVAQMLGALRAAGLKLTAPRVALVEEIAGDESHPTAHALFERLRRRLPGVSFATVYNTLAALTSAGACSSLSLGGSMRFDPNMAPHHHTVCDACGAIADIPVDAGDRVLPRVHGFDVRAVERVVRGTCAACGAGRPPREHAVS